MKNKIFGMLQKIGKSFMLPIAILPIAGFFLGIGSSLTNENTINGLHLEYILGKGMPLRHLLMILKSCGSILFTILPLIFALSVAIGLAKSRKEVAALSSLIAFFAMHASISGMMDIHGLEASTFVMGIPSLEMGVFGGILVGLGVGFLHNRFYQIQLPTVLSFFEGERFVPIISTIVFFIVGLLMFYVWPSIELAILALGSIIDQTGYIGTFIYGFIKRILVPFGLHHIWYTPFYQSALGGTMMINGELIQGAQNIFFAQLNDPSVLHYSVEASRFFTGDYIPIVFGLPGAALAMYQLANHDSKKKVAGLLITATLTSVLTGITEPLEFTFLFVAPILYLVNALLVGTAFVVCELLKVAVGFTFSSSLIDLVLFGFMQGASKTNWPLLVGVGFVYFGIYYIVFRTLILKFDFHTIGREEGKELKVFKNKPFDYTFDESLIDPTIQMIVRAVGGRDNFEDLDCCVTRLRMTIHDTSLVDQALLKRTGAAGIMLHGDGLQIIYGPQASNIKTKVEEYLEIVPERYDFIEKVKQKTTYKNVYQAICQGESYDLSLVSDIIYASQMMGDGIAIKPTSGKVYSPCNGTISMVYPTNHALGIKDSNGHEILLHFGINSVKLNGDGFNLQVKIGDEIKAGDLLWDANLSYLKTYLEDESIIFVVTNLKENEKLNKNYGIIDTEIPLMELEG